VWWGGALARPPPTLWFVRVAEGAGVEPAPLVAIVLLVASLAARRAERG
jgi:hypothetical protein